MSPRPRLVDKSAIGKPNIVIYPGWFNPPTFRHVQVVERLKEVFDRVVVVPLSRSRNWTSENGDYGELGVVHGGGTDSNSSSSSSLSSACDYDDEASQRRALKRRLINYIPTPHRAGLADLAFGSMDRVTVDLSDLEVVEEDEEDDDESSKECTSSNNNNAKGAEAHSYMNIIYRYTQETPGIEVWNAFGQEVLLNPDMRALFDAQWDTLTKEQEKRHFIVFRAPHLVDCMVRNFPITSETPSPSLSPAKSISPSIIVPTVAAAGRSASPGITAVTAAASASSLCSSSDSGSGCNSLTSSGDGWCEDKSMEAVYMFLDHPCGSGGLRSRIVRDMVYRNEDISEYVPAAVRDCIVSRSLYRGVPSPLSVPISMGRPRALFYYDERNPAACEAKEFLAPDLEDTVSPNIIIVIGGDGTMIRAIRSLWRKRLPFFGINCGHLGFLLNELEEAKRFILSNIPQKKKKSSDAAAADMKAAEVKGDTKKKSRTEWDSMVHHLPLLQVEYEDMQGKSYSEICFNDAWIERQSGQSAWTRISINGVVRISKMVSDGVLISTAAGSTAYAQSMGCCPIPVGTPLICLTGSNVATPIGWRPAYLPLDCSVTFEALNLEKRPVKGFVDGVELGPIRKMRVSTSNVGECSLIFLKANTMLNKLLKLQFPMSPSN